MSKTKSNFPFRDLGARKAIIQLHQATNIAITDTHQRKKKMGKKNYIILKPSLIRSRFSFKIRLQRLIFKIKGNDLKNHFLLLNFMLQL